MTGEVGRLQKERQALEQQIGDLFTFYAKQKSLTAGLVRGSRFICMRADWTTPVYS